MHVRSLVGCVRITGESDDRLAHEYHYLSSVSFAVKLESKWPIVLAILKAPVFHSLELELFCISVI